MELAAASEVEFLYVPPAKALVLWPRMHPHIKAALNYSSGEYEPQDLLDLALASKAQLWSALDNGCVIGAACSQVIEYPRKRVLQIITLAGWGYERWAGLAMDEARRFASTQGCTVIRINGRPGWVRRLADYGYSERYRQVDLVL